MSYDVVVVGAGPAGSTAAKYLSENGVKVLLIDKSKFPRDKSCGGALPIRTLQKFPYLKNGGLIESYSYGGCAYYSILEYKTEIQKNEPVLAMVIRKKFDYGLVNLAINSGAEFVDRRSVDNLKISKDNASITLNDGANIEAKIIIGADGVYSNVAMESGLCQKPQPVSRCICQEYPLRSNILDDFFSKKRLCYIFLRFQEIGGYGWVYPKKSHVNIGIEDVRIDKQQVKYKSNLKELYKKYFSILKENNIIPEYLEMGKIREASFPIFPLKKTFTDRVLVCGDAGGFINPVTGEGIYYAMRSGRFAADVAIQALAAQDTSARFLSQYETMWKNDFGNDIALQRHWAGHVKKFYRSVILDRQLSDMLLDIATGQVSVKECRWKLIRRFPYVYFKDLLRKK